MTPPYLDPIDGQQDEDTPLSLSSIRGLASQAVNEGVLNYDVLDSDPTQVTALLAESDEAIASISSLETLFLRLPDRVKMEDMEEIVIELHACYFLREIRNRYEAVKLLTSSSSSGSD